MHFPGKLLNAVLDILLRFMHRSKSALKLYWDAAGISLFIYRLRLSANASTKGRLSFLHAERGVPLLSGAAVVCRRNIWNGRGGRQGEEPGNAGDVGHET